MTLDELLLEWSYRTKKGYPCLDNPSDITILKTLLERLNLPSEKIIEGLKNENLNVPGVAGMEDTPEEKEKEDAFSKEKEEKKKKEPIDSMSDLNPKVVLDPHQDSEEIDNKIEDLQDLIKNASSENKDKIRQYINDLQYIDTVNNFIENKNFNEVEQIFVEAYTRKHNQYKTYSEYISKMPSYNALPSEGSFISFFEKYGFSKNFISSLLTRDYQAGGKGVGPGEILLVSLLKDTFKGNKGDITVEEKDTTGKIVAGEKEIEIKAAGAQLSPYSRSDDYHNNLYKWFPKNFPDYFTIYKEGKRRVPYRLESVINRLDSDKASEFLDAFIPYFVSIYSERVDVKPALDKAIQDNKFNGIVFENEMAKILAQAYIQKENIEGFLFLNKKTGNFDTFTPQELISNIGPGKIEVNAFSDMSPRLRLKKK